jgi:hypothetical protein
MDYFLKSIGEVMKQNNVIKVVLIVLFIQFFFITKATEFTKEKTFYRQSGVKKLIYPDDTFSIFNESYFHFGTYFYESDELIRSIWYISLQDDLPEGAYVTDAKLVYRTSTNYSFYAGFIGDYPQGLTNDERWELTENSITLKSFPGSFSSQNPITQPFPELVDYLQNAYNDGKSTVNLSFKSNELSSIGRIRFYELKLIITYDVKVNYSVKNNFDEGILKINGEEVSSGVSSFPFNEGTNYQFEAIEPQMSNDSYEYIWNDVEGSNYKSDWHLIDNNGLESSLGYASTIDHQANYNENNSTIKANLRKKLKITRDDQPEFAVLQTNQSTSYVVEQNSGQIIAPSTKTINNITYNFAGWNDDFTQSASRTISPDDNETYTALYKYKNHSNNTNGFAGNGQKKVVRRNNELFKVYESMNKLWLESSSDNGVTWNIKNGGKPIVAADAKHPSVAFEDGTWRMFMVYQQGESIRLALIDASLSTNNLQADVEVSNSNNGIEDYPVVSVVLDNTENKILVVYRRTGFGAGLYYSLYKVDGYGNLSYENSYGIISGTNEYSQNPSIGSLVDQSSPYKFHLVYQQSGAIYYKKYSLSGTTISQINSSTISTGSGFTNNYNPSITVLSDNSPVVSWVGYRTLIDERLEKANAGTYEERIVLRRGYSSGSWSSTFYKYDDGVNTPNIASAGNTYAFGWSDKSANVNKIVRSDLLTVQHSTSIQGKDVQLLGADQLNSMKFSTLNTNQSPYQIINMSIPDPYEMSKLSSLAIANGREGIVTKGEAGFYYLIGDVVLDQTTINFTELTDETTIGNETELNSYLTTEEFTINNNSDLTFSVRFGTVDSVTTANTLNDNEYVRFRVELVDAATNELLGTFSSVEYTKTNLYQYNNIGYSVNTDGIGNKKVKIRLRVEDNVEAEYTIAQIIADETVLGKTNYTEISYLGELSVETYELAQNYPNPFNPETVIYYQIPESGEVSLKVYDMLGRELKTLVNQTQNQGRYEVKFNARDLASGVYIYRLQVNDFVTSKKMMLVK